ncbi:MAG: hypothetical protein NZ580_03640 [Bacteroidia bacterium]|nr:hypothetical protein [Bacteroidia bacterium]MDW8235141.1 hypothetical protein [Bacteroidia bacterium]
MESLRFHKVLRLAEVEAPLALTAYLPVAETPATLSTEIEKVREKAEKAIAKHEDRKAAENFRTNLEFAIGQVVENNTLASGTWLLAVTTSESQAIFLPFVWEEEIHLGKSLKVGPALYALYRTHTLFVVLVSENTARLFEYVGGRLFPMALPSAVKEALHQLQKARHQMQNTFTDSPHYSELFAQMARSSYTMALVKYEETLQQTISFYLDEERVPTLLMGEERIIRELAKRFEGKSALSVIGGVPETASPEIILAQVQQHLQRQHQVLAQMYLPFLDYSETQSPKEIWEILQEAPASPLVLFVEEGYSFPASELLGKKRNLPTQNGIDLFIAEVRKRGGEVLFMPTGRLPQPIMLILL